MMMKKVIKALLAAVMCVVSKVYTYGVGLEISHIRNLFYTLWIRNFIGEIGENSSIYFPCILQGGGAKRIHIGCNTCIQSRCILGCWERYNAYDGQQEFTPEILIGNNCSIGEFSQITAINRITIGNGLLTGRFVYIGDNSHGGLSWKEADIPPIRRKLQSKSEVKIGNNVWIGDKVTILGGVTIGDNVIIGANSVVTHNLPSNCVAVGIPAKVVKKLD